MVYALEFRWFVVVSLSFFSSCFFWWAGKWVVYSFGEKRGNEMFAFHDREIGLRHVYSLFRNILSFVYVKIYMGCW